MNWRYLQIGGIWRYLQLNWRYIQLNWRYLQFRRFPRSMRSQGKRRGCGSRPLISSRVKRVDHDDVFDALLFREETLTRHYFILKFDFAWGIRTNMGKTKGIFLNLQCNCHIVGSITIKLFNHRTISVHGCQI